MLILFLIFVKINSTILLKCGDKMIVIIEDYDEYNNLIKENISGIKLDELSSNTNLYLYDTSLEKPYAIDIYTYTLYINKKYFILNYEKTMEFIIDTIESTKRREFFINNNEFINKETINAIMDNQHALVINFDCDRGFTKEEIIYLLSDKTTVRCNIDFESSEELLYEHIPGLKIKNYPKVAECSVMDFGMEEVELFILRELSNAELNQLKKLFEKYPQEEIYVNFNYKNQIKEIMDIIKSEEIIICDPEDYNIDGFQFFDKNYNNVSFDNAHIYSVDPKTLILKEEILNMIANEVKAQSLSPLEKYMYLYNIVKLYKEYQECDKIENIEDRFLSRNSHFTLFNDYMVCVGYATLLEELVSRLNDPNLKCTTFGCEVIEKGESFGHCRCVVKIEDDKYNVDGIYISDPTWDCVSYHKSKKKVKSKTNKKFKLADRDSYNHFLFTKEEKIDEKVKYYGHDAYDMLFGSGNFEDNYFNRYIDLANIRNIFNLEEDDDEYNDGTDVIEPEPISAKVIIKAIGNIYSKIYCNNVENLVQKTVEWNDARQEEQFKKTKNKFKIKSKK